MKWSEMVYFKYPSAISASALPSIHFRPYFFLTNLLYVLKYSSRIGQEQESQEKHFPTFTFPGFLVPALFCCCKTCSGKTNAGGGEKVNWAMGVGVVWEGGKWLWLSSSLIERLSPTTATVTSSSRWQQVNKESCHCHFSSSPSILKWRGTCALVQGGSSNGAVAEFPWPFRNYFPLARSECWGCRTVILKPAPNDSSIIPTLQWQSHYSSIAGCVCRSECLDLHTSHPVRALWEITSRRSY